MSNSLIKIGRFVLDVAKMAATANVIIPHLSAPVKQFITIGDCCLLSKFCNLYDDIIFAAMPRILLAELKLKQLKKS
jgi:hypothetical protein